MSGWLKGLKAKWLTHTSVEGVTARIHVRDIDAARMELLQSLSRLKLPVFRFQIATPALEDVFLQLVENMQMEVENEPFFRISPQRAARSLAGQAFSGGDHPAGRIWDDVALIG